MLRQNKIITGNFFRMYDAQGTMLSTLHVVSHLILKITLTVQHYYFLQVIQESISIRTVSQFAKGHMI